MNVLENELKDNGILILTLNRQDKLNALNDEVLENLNEQFSFAKNNEKVKALLLTGKGNAFCAGADIKKLAECDSIKGLEFAKFGQEVFRNLEILGKPSLAAINGYAFGGGLELAMAASIRIASNEAQFGQPEVKLGVIPGYGGTQRLARLVGKGRALDLCLTGRFIDSSTALSWGLITNMYEQSLLLTKGEEILLNILKMAPLAITSVMEVIDKGYDLPLQDALTLEALYFANLCSTEDKQEGVSAFLNKKMAEFKGR